MTVQEKFEQWRQDYRLRTYDDNTYLYEDQLAAYLFAAKEAREEAIRECTEVAVDALHNGTGVIGPILALLEKQ